jgi:hypothetical protein
MPKIAACLAMALLAAVPATATATDYCVAPNTTCGGTNVATFQAALDAADAAANADRVFLGAAVYTAPTTAGFNYDAPSFPVEIVGAGVASTELTAPDTAAGVMRLQGGPGSLIRDLTVALPPNLPASPFSFGLWIFDPALNVAVESDPTNIEPHLGVLIGAGGSLTGSTVTLSQAIANVTGVIVQAGASALALDNTTIVAYSGVTVQEPGTSIEGVEVTSRGEAVTSYRPDVSLRSSILRPIQGGVGGTARDQPTLDADLILDGVTIFGDGSPSSTGVGASNLNGGQTSSVTLKNSIIRNVARSAYLNTSVAAGAAAVTARYSDYDPATVSFLGGPGVETATPAAGLLEPGANLNVDPLFTSSPGDLSLSLASPLIDRGDPAAVGGLDFGGAALVTDGNGDGTPRRDMGAYERPVPLAGGGGAGADVLAASISRFRAVPKRFAVLKRKAAARRGTKFRWRLDEAAVVTITVARALPGRRKAGACRRPTRRNRGRGRCIRYRNVGRLQAKGVAGTNGRAFRGRFKRRALKPGPYRALMGAVDLAGNISKPRAARFKVVRSR